MEAEISAYTWAYSSAGTLLARPMRSRAGMTNSPATGAENLGKEFLQNREQAMGVLQQESSLNEIVQLVGKDYTLGSQLLTCLSDDLVDLALHGGGDIGVHLGVLLGDRAAGG